MVIWMFTTVILRYALNTSAIWQQELMRYLHIILFMSTVGYTLQKDQHVRVDILYQKCSETQKARINLIGCIVFAIPMAVTILYYSWNYIISAWSLLESSAEPLGLPGVFLIKTMIWVFATSLLLQTITIIGNSLTTLTNPATKIT